MGKSAVKMARATAAKNYVEPKADAAGYTQPGYVRGGIAIQTSKKLKYHQHCVAAEMSGKSFSDRGAVHDALSSAAKSCKTKNPY